jgi:hypothetical protein
MSLTPEQNREIATLPAELRSLLDAELAAGNALVEIGHSFPAPPVGAYFKLARPVSTRLRESGAGLKFYDRNGSDYSGEFADDRRHFFILEPPHPPEPPPDMNAIRAELEARQRAADAARERDQADGERQRDLEVDRHAVAGHRAGRSSRRSERSPRALQHPLYARFLASMAIDYDQWREGVGYDLTVLKEAPTEVRLAIEALLIARRTSDWRDVEALAALGTENARRALRDVVQNGDSKVRLAVHLHAPELLTAAERCSSLVRALQEAETYTGLTEALMEVEDFHPPEVLQALLRGLIQRDGGTAVHLAAMLYYLHGQAAEPFDWKHRPFFLRFNTTDPAERAKAARELCATIGVDPQACFRSGSATAA